jgi:hypothetical protein
MMKLTTSWKDGLSLSLVIWVITGGKILMDTWV